MEAGGVHGNRPPVLCNEEEREEGGDQCCPSTADMSSYGGQDQRVPSM